MSAIETIVKSSIAGILPSLPDEKLDALARKLTGEDVGVEAAEDLQHVREEDLLSHLTPIQCRKLKQSWNVQGIPFKLNNKY